MAGICWILANDHDYWGPAGSVWQGTCRSDRASEPINGFAWRDSMGGRLQGVTVQGGMVDTEVLHKEIDLIQGCISRMANNSFLIKGWWISLCAVVLAILQERAATVAVVMLLISMTASFWALDAAYLRMERKYRELYKQRIGERLRGAQDHLYDLDTSSLNSKVSSLLGVMISRTLWPFYCLPLIAALIIALVL